MLTFSAGGYICKLLGWAALFYIPGGISIVWLALWTALVANDPAQHRFISDAERDYILASQGRTKQRTARAADASSSASKPLSLAARVRAVWPLLRNVITSPCVLALCVANVAFDYGGYTFLTNIPSFMDEVRVFTYSGHPYARTTAPFIYHFKHIIAVCHCSLSGAHRCSFSTSRRMACCRRSRICSTGV